MSNLMKRKSRRVGRRSPMGLLLLILVWSLAMGWVLALATNSQGATPASSIGTVDVIPTRHQLGQQLYLENCATCHIAIPPAVLPSETWKDLLQDPQHYGAQLTPLVDPPRTLVWRYLLTFSRSVIADEQKPYHVNDSRYFKILHPRVKLPRPVQLTSCVTCHLGAGDYNFRSLTPEWENSQ